MLFLGAKSNSTTEVNFVCIRAYRMLFSDLLGMTAQI